MSGTFVSKSVVRFNHTDPASYVFFPRYFEMIQAAVEDWFTLGMGINYADLVNHDRLGLPTARTECEFARPSRLGETVELALYVTRIGNSSLEVLFDGSVGGEHRLRARSVLVFISLEDGRPRPIPPSMRIQLEAYRARQGAVPGAKADT
ncbi:MAG: acyl-CoA thioesterase [Hyphomicrobiales bacterium]|nr:acyl-CoA thioesterase [Hyphomicrobiales bacterium]